jgi:hypothetical protein
MFDLLLPFNKCLLLIGVIRYTAVGTLTKPDKIEVRLVVEFFFVTTDGTFIDIIVPESDISLACCVLIDFPFEVH